MVPEPLNIRLLIVDDETSLSELLKYTCAKHGMDVQTCDNGEAALQIAREFRPDVILLDLMMPGLSGFDTIDLIKTTPETSATRIIIFSALSQPEDIARTKALGADDFIVKSQLSLDDIVEHIKQAAVQ